MKISDVYRIRKSRLRLVMNEEFQGKQALLASKLGRQPDYISRILNDRKMLAEDLAREFEEILGKPAYWLDGIAEIEQKNLESKVITQSELTWPFESISIEIFQALPERTKGRIEENALGIIKDYELKNTLKERRAA